jgi:hypothetical protein
VTPNSSRPDIEVKLVVKLTMPLPTTVAVPDRLPLENLRLENLRAVASCDAALDLIMTYLIYPISSKGRYRTQTDSALIELALYLIRNLLFMPPASVLKDLPVFSRFATAQDASVRALSRCHALDMVLLIAQDVDDDDNRDWNLLVLEVIAFIFFEEDPRVLRLGGGVGGVGDGVARAEDVGELKAALARERAARARSVALSKRTHSRFGGAFVQELSVTPPPRLLEV